MPPSDHLSAWSQETVCDWLIIHVAIEAEHAFFNGNVRDPFQHGPHSGFGPVFLTIVMPVVFGMWRERIGIPVHRVGRFWEFQLSQVDEGVRADDSEKDLAWQGKGGNP
jgi:hypothetical protein